MQNYFQRMWPLIEHNFQKWNDQVVQPPALEFDKLITVVF